MVLGSASPSPPPAEADILQALVFFDEANAMGYGLALWAALHEVERFYAPIASDKKIVRFFVSRISPEPNFLTQIAHSLGKVFVGGALSALDVFRPGEVIARPQSVDELADPFRRVIDQTRLAETVRGIVGATDLEIPFTIVTDRPIRPPPEWRYIIWEDTSDFDTVLSVAPLDPQFWGERDSSRAATIKNRARSALLGITGLQFGIEECSNPECVMYSEVDSVTTLDDMTSFGPEHGNEQLEGRHFPDVAKDPVAIEQVLTARVRRVRR